MITAHLRRPARMLTALATAFLVAGCVPDPGTPPATTTTTTSSPTTTSTTTTSSTTTSTTSTTTSTTTTSTTTTTAAPVACAPGSYSSTGLAPCTAASAGFFVSTPQATEQAICSLGTYQPATGQSSCLLAPVGTYVDTSGATAPTSCPAGWATPGVGSIVVWSCFAPYLTAANTRPEPYTWGVLTGEGLQPGATIYVCADSFGCVPTIWPVDTNGTPGLVYTTRGSFSNCQTNVYFFTTTWDGRRIESNRISGC